MEMSKLDQADVGRAFQSGFFRFAGLVMAENVVIDFYKNTPLF
jgi:hypothetical protein